MESRIRRRQSLGVTSRAARHRHSAMPSVQRQVVHRPGQHVKTGRRYPPAVYVDSRRSNAGSSAVRSRDG
jgi:hypothetical protein